MSARVSIEMEAPFRERLKPLAAVLEGGEIPPALPAVKVKESTVRTVHRVEVAPDLVVFVKRARPRGGAERAKYALVASHARAEWENLGRLKAAGLDVPERIAFAERRGARGLEEAVLVTRAVEPVRSIRKDVEEGGAAREAALRAAGALARRLHDAGFFHRDFHAGNLLARGGEGAPRIVMVDVQKAWRLPWVPRALRARDLGVLFHDLADVLEDRDRRVVLAAYGADARLAARVLRAEARRRRERLRSRGKRCLVPSTSFRVERRGDLRIYRRADVPLDALLATLERHAATIAAGKGAPGYVKADQATSVSRQPPLGETGEAAGEVAVKRFPERGLVGALARALVPGRGRRGWVAGHALRLRGIDCPVPLALVERRRFGIPTGSWLLTRWVPGAEDLHRASERRPGPAVERAVVREVARIIARLHRERLYHNDLKPTNILVAGLEAEGGPRVLLLDLDAVWLSKRLTARRRAKNIAEIEDYTRLYMPGVRRAHRLRFLIEYGRAAYPELSPMERRRVLRAFAKQVEDEVDFRVRRRARRGW